MSGPIVLALRLVLVFALYGFLGFALLTLWRDLVRQGSILEARRVPEISLSLVAEGGAAAVRKFTKPEITVGRDLTCDISLADEAVSARHARFSHHHGQWWLEDLASKNGTQLNGSPVIIPTVLASGDEVRCGSAKITVAIAGASHVAAAAIEGQK